MPKPKEIVIREDLSPAEVTELKKLEQTIERGLQTFFEVGSALMDIRDKRLYRATHKTFEDYCNARWQFSRVHAHRLITAASVMQNLLPMGNILPETERQARALNGLTPEQQQAAWGQAVEQAEGSTPTAAQVAAAADQVKGKPARFKADRWYAVDDRNRVIYDDPATSERELGNNALYFDCAVAKGSTLDRPDWASFKLVKPPKLTILQPEHILAAFGPEARYAVHHEQRTIYRDPIQPDQEALYADCQILSGTQLRRVWWSAKYRMHLYLMAPARKSKPVPPAEPEAPAAPAAEPKLDPNSFYACLVNKRVILNHPYQSSYDIDTDWPEAKAMSGATWFDPANSQPWHLVSLVEFEQIYSGSPTPPRSDIELDPEAFYASLLNERVLLNQAYPSANELFEDWPMARVLTETKYPLTWRVVNRDEFQQAYEAAYPPASRSLAPDRYYVWLLSEGKRPDCVLAAPNFATYGEANRWAKARYRYSMTAKGSDLLSDVRKLAEHVVDLNTFDSYAERLPTADGQPERSPLTLRYQLGMAAHCPACERLKWTTEPYTDWTLTDKPGIWQCPRKHRRHDTLMRIVEAIQPAAEDLPDHVDHPAPAATPTPDQPTMRWAGTEYEAVNRISRDAGQLITAAFEAEGRRAAEIALKVAQAILRAAQQHNARGQQAQELLTQLGYQWHGERWQRPARPSVFDRHD